MRSCLGYFFGGMFLAAGLLCGILFFVSAYQYYTFLYYGEDAIGTVTQFKSEQNDGKLWVAPIITYQTTSGRTLEYHHDVYASPSTYAVGDRFPLRYHSKHPEKVVDRQRKPVWFLLLFLFTHGGAGAYLIYYIAKTDRLRSWLKIYGREILATYSHTERGAKGSRWIVCTWEDPLTHKQYTFQSDGFPKGAKEYVAKVTQVPVLIDPDNPERYWVLD